VWTYNSKGRNEKCLQIFSRKKLNGRDHLTDLGLDARIILTFILTMWTGLMWFRIRFRDGIFSTR